MRRASAAHNPGVSLFPFLAVLICTMGVMMLLLVIINRPGAAAVDDSEPPPGAVFEEGGKGSAATVASGNGGAAGAASAVSDELAQAREMLDWRISQLQISRDKTVGDLRDERLRLTTVEEGMRKLRGQWELVKKAAGDLEQADTAKDHDKQSVAAFVDRLKSDLNATHAKVGRAIQDARSEPPAYAIVPYDGPNGTRRQPIYIECRNDAIVLQPEGIALTEKDFDGPKGPGNPLASTIRAARDYLAGGTAPVPGREPYPLLIVRSDGIVAFYRARSAMSSWASDFGYELIEADRKLVFQRPDPQLAQVENAALTDARTRYAWFATTRTGQEEQQPHERPVYRVSGTGGIKREGQASLDDADGASGGSGDGSSGFGAPGNRFGAAGTGGGPGGTGTGGAGTGSGSGYGNGNGYGVGAGATGGALAGGPGGGSAYVPDNNYVALPGSGGPGGSGYGTGGSGSGGSGYGNGGSPGGLAGGPGYGQGNGSSIGSGTGNGGGPGVGSGNGSNGGQPFVPGNGYIGLPGSGGPGGSNSGVAGSGYGTGGSPGTAPGGFAGGPGNGSSTGNGGGPSVGSAYGSGNGSNGGQPFVPGNGYMGLPGGGGSSGMAGGPNIGYPGAPVSSGMNGSGNPGVAGAGTTPAGYGSGVPTNGVPSGTQSTGYTSASGSSGTNSQGALSGSNSGFNSNNFAAGQSGAAGSSGAMAGDPSSMPPPGTPTSNVTLTQAGGASGASGASDGGDGAPPSGMSMMMQSNPQQPHSSSSLDNINATPYPLQSGPTGPHPGEYVPSSDPVTYSDKPKPPDDNAAKSHDSLAEKRGHNWSLPSQAKLSTPVSRTIHIECRGDRLVLKPDFGNPQPRVIMFGPRTADSVDKLVAAVWDYTKGWGIAGRQMYWRPRLELELGLSGEGRYSELQALLADSGLEVARKQSTTTMSATQLR